LRKYYPRNIVINEKNKSIYIALLLDPRIKRDGLESIGIPRTQAIDIYNKLKIDYNQLVYFLIIYFEFFLIYFRYKRNYQLQLPFLQETRVLDIEEDPYAFSIYVQNNKNKDMDELDQYLKENRRGKNIFPLILKSY
jgi:hypothetical protein